MSDPIELEMYVGDSKEFDIAVTEDGAAVDISTGWTFEFTAVSALQRSPAPTSFAVDNADFEIVNGPGGLAKMTIAPEKTTPLGITADAIYVFSLRGSDGTEPHTLATGHLLLMLSAAEVAS